MKKPMAYKDILSHIHAACTAGRGSCTAYSAAKSWGVSVTTARSWLQSWNDLFLVFTTTEHHRKNIVRVRYHASQTTIDAYKFTTGLEWFF